MAAFTSLEDLARDRRSYVDISRVNRFEEGLRALLSDLYPDNAHFIYELLANAEDAGASTVDFDLGRSRLVFSHDGARSFSLDDIDSITGLGQSTKKTDATQIGKFGVGFKAVFAYTASPEVQSGEHSFAIRDMFVPEPLSGRAPAGKTVFTFPFNRREKPRGQAFDEVKRGLEELSDTAVLFLSSIASIRYRTADGASGRISRTAVDKRYVTITSIIGPEKRDSHWLLLRGGQEISAAIPERQSVAAAFALAGPPNRRIRAKGVARAKVEPLRAGQTCIYFPAAKESSGLRFHVHAPFASTVARDSVRDARENDGLFDAIGQLIARELPGLTEEGLMDDGLLGALPNSADELGASYERIRTPIVEAFNTQWITPVSGGRRYSPAVDLVNAPSEIRAGVGLDDVRQIASMLGLSVPEKLEWMATRDGRPRQLLADLDAFGFGWSELRNCLSAVNLAASYSGSKEPIVGAWVGMLKRKSDDELLKFQTCVGKGLVDGKILSVDVNRVPLFRVMKSGKRHLAAGGRAFLPAGQGGGPVDGVIPDQLATFHHDEVTATKYALEKLFSAAGVARWDDREQLRERLANYDGRSRTAKAHIEDIVEFAGVLKSRPEDHALFSSSPIFKAATEQGPPLFVAPSHAFLDKPYLDTGLTAFYAASPERRVVAEIYAKRVPDFVSFAQAVGVTTGLSLTKSSLHKNPQVQRAWSSAGRETEYARTLDWDFPELERVVASASRALKKCLWEMLCELSADYAEATFQLNASSQPYVVKTRLAQRLTSTKWVSSRTGTVKLLSSVSESDLTAGWTVPKNGSLLVRLGFGAQQRARSEAEKDQRRTLVDLGLDSGTIDDLLALPKAERNAVLSSALSQLRQKQSFPGKAATNPEMRGSIVAEDALEAPVFESVARKRMVVKGESDVRDLAKDYLRRQYTRADNEMHCQACQLEMPFKIDGRSYFEAVQFQARLQRQHKQNYLALCPLCAALYRFARTTDDRDVTNQLAAITIGAETERIELSIRLDDKPRTLVFTGVHALDLREVLGAAGTKR